jgi:hypothetical protein
LGCSFTDPQSTLGLQEVAKIKTKDFELYADPTAQQTEVKVPEITLGDRSTDTKNQISPELIKRREEIAKIDVSPIVLEQEQLIKKDVELLRIPSAELPDILIRHLAVTQLVARAETIYRTIFGSQIQLLKAVNHFGPRTRDELMDFYNRAKSEFPSIASYPFENYLNYLISHGLLIQEQDRFAITVAGKEFLKYLVDINASENKAF